jgi:uncharacterized protein (TIGR02266 family)
MGIEKRRYPRVYVKLPGEYRGKYIWQKVTIYNLSEGGMFVATEKVEPPGTQVQIIFELGNKDNKMRFYIEATVVWNREKEENKEGRVFPAGMGVEFKKILPSEAKKFLKEVIEEILKKGGKNNGQT